jgi:N utilization substance protein A
MKALAPARVREVRVHDDTGTAVVIVTDFQLSLAIGKEGQNARLAARLTGWRVDIKSETQLHDEETGVEPDYAAGEWIENEAGELVFQPAEGGEAISEAAAGYEPTASDAASADAPVEATAGGDAPVEATAGRDAAEPDATATKSEPQSGSTGEEGGDA